MQELPATIINLRKKLSFWSCTRYNKNNQAKFITFNLWDSEPSSSNAIDIDTSKKSFSISIFQTEVEYYVINLMTIIR